jgi:diguanylate cyclase (GGDEF)-like protein
MRPAEYFNKLPKTFCVLSCTALLAVIGFLDYITGEEISFSVFYLIPVSLATWRTNRGIGIFFCFFAAVVWFYADMLPGHVYSHPVIPYWNALVRLCFFLIVSFLLAKLKDSLLLEKDLARTDALTGLLNMRAFYDSADIEMRRARRFRRPFTVAYMDVDNFKMVNDQFGHDVGSTLLRSIAETIRANVRAIDLTARLGGDEFVFFLGETGKESALLVFTKLQDQIINVFEKSKWPVTLSIGVVTYNKSPDTVDEILKKADALMYSAKNSGKNKIMHETIG